VVEALISTIEQRRRPTMKNKKDTMMTCTTIRQVKGEEMLEVKYPLGSYAFNSSPPLPDKEEWKDLVRHRQGVTCLAAFEEDTAVATAAYTAMTQNVRGALFGMGGVWGVATHPAARHKGYCRELTARLLACMHASGQSLSGLYPFRESFYERLGYVTLPQIRKARFAPLTLRPLLKQDLGGAVELMLSGEGYEAYRDYLHQMQAHTHGMAMFDVGDKVSAQRNRAWLALARVGGEPVGLMLYDLRGEKETEFNLRAWRFYYRSSQGKYLLLQWIARHIDQANRVELWLPPFELPETWLADMDVTVETAYFTPMGRVVDVAGIGGMRTGPGRFSARIADPLCPWNEGIWHFETVDGALQVHPAKQAGCELSVQALAALIYGTHDPGDFTFRGWGNPSPEVQATMRTMFPRMLPHIHEIF
jgi:predicted acetyltransferase